MNELKQSTETELLEWLLTKKLVTFYVVILQNGVVYQRNEGFEAGYGRLFEPIGSLPLDAIEANKKNMSSDIVSFMTEKELKEMNAGWQSGMNAESLARYL